MHCPSCGTANPAQARFCLNCGHLLVSGIICQACHTLLPHYARYCYHCGTFLPQASGAPPHEATFAVQTQPVVLPQVTPQPQPVTTPSPATMPAPPAQSVTPITPPAVKPTTVAAPPAAPEHAVGQLPLTPRPMEELLPSLKLYLPDKLYEPLERRPNERDLAAVRNHLEALLGTVKTYLPWPVVKAPQPVGMPDGRMYRGVFLFGDVSGFTPLSEKLKPLGQLGAERIADIINTLFYQLVKELFDHGGTLLKFGGDAMLGLFPAETDEEMIQAAQRAAQTALAMQRVMEREEFAAIPIDDKTGEMHTLKIKCGISAGPYFSAHIGTQPRPERGLRGTMAYVTTGHTVNLAEGAEGHANPGEVTMTQAVCELLGDKVETGPVTKSPDEKFRLLLSAPPVEAGTARLEIAEPPEGDVQLQITYLVERLDRLTPYLSADLISRIAGALDPKNVKITPEHRPFVTIMFVNYKGISDLIEDLGNTQPELITHHLNNYFVHMAHIVEKYEGTLARMDQYAVGDRLVIFFGAPRAHEDDPVRAIRTALEMQEAALKDEFRALTTPEGLVYRFEQRIGINTGALFSGNVGATGLRQEYTLMGDDINMAARLMSNAVFPSIFISKRTQEHAAGYFEMEDLGELKVKGKEIRIHTFKVLRLQEETTSARRQANFTGRQEELDNLKVRGDLLLKGRGQIVTIAGKSGLGKSRLVSEFKNRLQNQAEANKLLWIDARALSFSEQMTYWTATMIMYALLGFDPDADNKADVLYTLGQQARELLGKENAKETIPYLAYMMSLEMSEDWTWIKDEDPKVRQKQTLWAVSQFFDAVARQRPIVVALDDLHWADEASLTLIEHLMQVTDRAPLMLCLVFRVQRDKRCWQLRNKAASDYPHRYLEIDLAPLSMPESQQLLSGLLPGAEFPDKVLQEILEKSAGNPFYLEEVVRTLINDHVVIAEAVEPDYVEELVNWIKRRPVQSRRERWKVNPDKIEKIKVPDSLQGAITARIDRLTEDARQALQMAAVIGRQFRLRLLRNLTQAEAEIDIWVSQLERGGLVSSSETSVDPLYAFPDALVQEVAYESLLVQDRQKLHQRTGETLETFFADKLEQGCELLAFHFSRSDDHERAAKYLEMSAKKARNDYANYTAIEHYEGLLKIKEELGDSAGQAATLHQMGVIAYEIGDYDKAKPWLERAAQLYQETDNLANVGWSVMYVGMVNLKQANYAESAEHHTHAMELAQQRQDTFQEGIHLTNLARVNMRLGQYELAHQQFSKSLEMKLQMKDVNGQGFALYHQGLIYIYQDQLDKADSALQGAFEVWQQVPKNERVMSMYHYGVGLLALKQNKYKQAEEQLQKAYDLGIKLVLKAETIDYLSALGQAKLGLGKLEDARYLSEEAVKLLEVQKDVEEVQQIYLDHYHILSALHDPSANDWLQKAYETMVKRAGQIEDEKERQIYLEQVRINRDILACMKKNG